MDWPAPSPACWRSSPWRCAAACAADLAEYAATLSQGLLRALALQRALLLWQEQPLGPAQDKPVIVDGKTPRHAHIERVSAVNGQGRGLGSEPVKAGSNDIPAAQQVLFEGGGDQVLTVKANQKALVKALETLLTPGAFFPLGPRRKPGR